MEKKHRRLRKSSGSMEKGEAIEHDAERVESDLGQT